MGYRSDVVSAFYVNTTEDNQADALQGLRAWYMLKKGECEAQDKSSADWLFPNFREVKRGYVFEAQDVKWYDSFEEVQMFDALADSFKAAFIEDIDGEADHAYEFIRTGEEDDDIQREEDGASDYVLQVQRSITCDL